MSVATKIRVEPGRNRTWRKHREREDLAVHAHASLPPSRIAVTGANGMVGTELVAFLGIGGHRVLRILRRPSGRDDEIRWDPDSGLLDPRCLDGVDAVVHLAGENIAAGRWSASTRRRILASRTKSTSLLCATVAALERPPAVLICASAVGYYGDRGDLELDESAGPGRGFLAEVCRQWEAATQSARAAGIRVVNARLGVVLSPHAGALPRMMLPFRFGLGGQLGSGRQYMSWISLDDLVAAILHCIATRSLDGPVNMTSPLPVTNAALTRSLAIVLRRWAVFPVPAFALRLLLGEMADEMLLASTRAVPVKLAGSGFVFRDPELRVALTDMLGLDLRDFQ
ncbi:MAG TPA: TIGR01777 family oxidoreductase [Candidatus Binatia bacterium]|jgi:hypothetical protein